MSINQNNTTVYTSFAFGERTQAKFSDISNFQNKDPFTIKKP